MDLDFSKVSWAEYFGIVAGALLVVSLLLFPWYDLAEAPRVEGTAGFVCGEGEFTCTGFETFPILRWFLIAAAAAPLILAYIVARSHRLSWAPGEMTMVVGFTAFVLILYNGIIDPVGAGSEEIGVTEQWGYFVALLAAVGIGMSGFLRAMVATRGPRKAPGTV